MAKTLVHIDDIKERIAARLSDNQIPQGDGSAGSLVIALARRATRTFRAHWTGFKIFYPSRVVVLQARLADGSLWSEGFISPDQPSWVLAFRKEPHASRGSGGPRPDDQVAPPQALEIAAEQRRQLIESGQATTEELIRMEDYDDPMEAVDAFFSYTTLYVLKAADKDWSQFGYAADPSIQWDEELLSSASKLFDEAIDESLKKSDILWLRPDTDPSRSIPCWYLYTRDKKLFVLSGEREQMIPDARGVREVSVITRWKGRDARMSEFDAGVRAITGAERAEFDDIARQLIAKRQSVRESTEETMARWLRECVILELKPRG
jgi:hypothetical protein